MIRLNNLAAAIAVMMVVTIAACKKNDEGGKGGKGGYSKDCNLTGTLIKTDYSKSALNNFWIQAASGEVYMPCANDVVNFQAEHYAEGQKVTFGTRALGEHEKCDNFFIECPVGMTMTTQRVGLTCINKASGKCNKSLVIRASSDTVQTVQVIDAWQEGDFVKVFIGFSGCDFDASPISLHWNGVIRNSQPAGITFELGNMPAPQMCQAYFVDTLCVDLHKLKPFGKEFSLNIKGLDKPGIPIKF